MTYISLSNNYLMFDQGIISDSYNIQIKNIFSNILNIFYLYYLFLLKDLN